MAHRKEEKEALRRQREEREAQARSDQQRKRLVGYGGAALIAIAAVVVIVFLAGGGGDDAAGGSGGFFPEGGDVAEQKQFDLEKAAAAAGCELKHSKGSGVATHTTSLDEKVKYKDNPPTTGRHYQIPAEDGVYGGTPPPDEALVHALEHGRVIIWAKPSLSEDERATIRAISDSDDGYQTLLVRRDNMPYVVAATAWNRDPAPGGTGRTLGCTKWNAQVVDALRAFRDEHRSNGPEPIP
ncbi:MAG: DUF3105 domain-containing protein [Thermoleophilaceae bacterium]